MSSPFLILDGSYGEGGGTLLRTALSLSALTLQPVRILNVRGATRHPGLDVEDLAIAHYLQESVGAQTEGLELGSHELAFTPLHRARGISGVLAPPGIVPGGRRPNALVVLNSLLPVLARSGMYSTLSVEGETYGNHSLSYDYFREVCLTAYQRLGLHAFVELERAAFGRESKGVIAADVEPSALHPIVWPERGSLQECRAVFAYSQLSPQIAQRGAAHLSNLARAARLDIEIDAIGVDAEEPGIFLTIHARYERGFGGATMMGAKGVRVESLSQSVMEDFLYWLRSNATMDSHLADQLLVALALADGESTFSVSQLTKRFLTSIWVVKQFAPIRITVKGKEGDRGTVTISR